MDSSGTPTFLGLFWPSGNDGPQFAAPASLVCEAPLWLDQSSHPSSLCNSCLPPRFPSPQQQTLERVLWQTCRVVGPCVFNKHKCECPGELVQRLPGSLFHSALCMLPRHAAACFSLLLVTARLLLLFPSGKHLGCL